MRSFLDRWFNFQKEKPVLFGFLILSFIAYATWVTAKSEIEAFPEFTNVQVQIITQYPGKAAEEVERQVTVPLEVVTTGVPGLINQRSTSIFGLSVITLTFDDEVKSKTARIDLSQRLTDAELPEGVKPALSPDTTPVGEIFRYVVKGALPVDELRMIEDWQLEREFKSIPGVADVVSFGGPSRTVEVRLDVTRMKALGLSVTTVAQALGQNHANAGGSFVGHGDEAYIVRSLGLYEGPEHIESAVVATQKNIPIRVRDIGSVQLSHKPRLGLVGHNENDDAVEGIILLRQGSSTVETCKEIRNRIQKLNNGVLPKGVTVQSYYDRTNLIRMSSHTVYHNILFGIFLVCLLLWLGFGGEFWPMIVAVALIIPFSLLMVFVCLRIWGYTPNLISLGAVDFGIIIETAIFSAEGIIAALLAMKISEQKEVRDAFGKILGPALLCAFLLAIAFIPILSLQRVEGRIFRPLGITLVAALVGGQLGTLIFVPLATWFCPAGSTTPTKLDILFERILESLEHFSKEGLKKMSSPVISISVFALLILFYSLLGREFLPNLNEGSMYVRATAPSTISPEASSELAAKIRRKLKEIPEVIDVVSQNGRPDDGTDVNGFDNIENLVTMLPPDEWRTSRNLEGFVKVAQEKLKEFEGVDFNFSQPIKDNVDEAISGVKGELVVKVFGPQVQELQRIGYEVSALLRSITGAEDVASEQLLGQPELRFNMKRDLLARYGLRVTDAEDVLETALLGKIATKLVDPLGRAVDIVVKPDLPKNPDVNLLSALPVLTPDGAKVPLGEVSRAELVEGVGRIYRELGERRIAVKCSVRNRPVVSFVTEASQKISQKIKLPDKYRLQWSGSFENAERATNQLLVVVPICLLAMVIILYTWFGSMIPVFFLLWELPFSGIGGFLLLKCFSLNLSISAAAGGVVLIGVTFLTGMMLINAWREFGDVWKAYHHKGKSILLSNLVAMIGLVPAAFSKGIGSETAKPFAVMILGGLLSSLILSLTVLPLLIDRADQKNKLN